MKRTAFQTYSEYTEAQTETNRRKLNRVWVSHEELQMIGKDIRAHTPVLERGVCHGVRGGFENSTLQDLLGVPVLGTEISASASSFANVIQHDFHELKAEWRGTFDFVYCNAWDHAYDLGKCLAAWADSLKPNGLLYLEWTREHAGEARGADSCKSEFPELLSVCSRQFNFERLIEGVMWTWTLSFKERLSQCSHLLFGRNFTSNRIFPYLVLVLRKKT